MRSLEVGEIPVPEESVLTVTLTLARIFPHIKFTYYLDENWGKVMDAISLSREIVDRSSKRPPPPSPHLRVAPMTPHQEPHSRTAVN